MKDVYLTSIEEILNINRQYRMLKKKVKSIYLDSQFPSNVKIVLENLLDNIIFFSLHKNVLDSIFKTAYCSSVTSIDYRFLFAVRQLRKIFIQEREESSQ
jgi:hypothetical protein